MVQPTVGKKKDKEKLKEKESGGGKKDLARQVERLQAENEALRARLERIAEIAGSDSEMPMQTAIAVLNTPDL